MDGWTARPRGGRVVGGRVPTNRPHPVGTMGVGTHDVGLVRVLGLVVLLPVVHAATDPDAVRVVGAVLGLVALAAHLVNLSGRAVVEARGPAVGLVLVTIAVGLTAHAVTGGNWVPVGVAAALQCAVRLEPLPTAIAGIAVCTGAGALMGDRDDLATSLVVVAGPGLVAALRHRLLVTIAELHATREQLADAAVRRERDRFSDDLHDLLGHSLSVIVVSAQVVQRVAQDRPDQARSVAVEMEAVGRRALDDVRAAVLGYRGRSLADESNELQRALRTAGITPDFDPPVDAPGVLDATLALVLRETVTNVVRHSLARHCRVELRADSTHVTMVVTDDGQADAAAATRASAGLVTVRARLTAHGGHVAVDAVEPHGLRVTAVVPIEGSSS